MGAPERIGSIPLVLGEHGDPTLAIPLSMTVAGSAVYDIVTAPASARRHNQRHPDAPKSPGTALALSFASTALPIAAGAVGLLTTAPEGGVALAFAGVVVGPSVGHWYAGSAGRGLATAGLRLGLSLLAGLTLFAAS